MAKERLSKLQKWILEQCLQNTEIYYRTVFKFFGKKFSCTKTKFMPDSGLKQCYGESPENDYILKERSFINCVGWNIHGFDVTGKKELVISNSEKAIISRSLKGLKDK
jgi:hypothetical protein